MHTCLGESELIGDDELSVFLFNNTLIKIANYSHATLKVS